MNADKLVEIMGEDGWSNPMNPHAHLPRYAAMCGFFEIPAMNSHYRIPGLSEIEIPNEIVPQILKLFFAEKANNNLRKMGESIGRLNINVPSNVNVWQHVKGESMVRAAIDSLTDATKLLTEKL